MKIDSFDRPCKTQPALNTEILTDPEAVVVSEANRDKTALKQPNVAVHFVHHDL
jgi:hypothetical protein